MRSFAQLFIVFFFIIESAAGSLFAQTAKDVPSIIEDALSSVVTVGVYKSDYMKTVMGMRGTADDAYAQHLDLTNAEGSGSGFVVNYQGKMYVVTNAHVVETASAEKEAIFVYSVTRRKYEVKIKGGDSFYDFAILEFLEQPGKELTALAFTLSEPRVGEQVFAIGNPLGEYPYTVSDGIISAKNRARGGITGKYGFLQSTATVIWGNSGGPLINTKGEVVGVNSQIAFADDGREGLWLPQINFALESAICRRLMESIFKNNGVVQRAYLGIEASQMYSIEFNPYTNDNETHLVDAMPRLTGLSKGSPAAEAISSDFIGAKISKINNVEIRNLNELLGELENAKAGSEISIMLEKGNVLKDVKFKTEVLQSNHLEMLAKDVFAKDERIAVSETADGISLTVKSGTMNNSRNKNTIAETNAAYTGSVIGLGYARGQNVNIWKIKTMSEAGAVLRMFGPTGICQLALTSAYRNSQNPEIYSLTFSNKEAELKTIVWY